MVCTKQKEGESSPALSVAASLDSGGEDVGGVGLLLCPWAENSSCQLMVRNSVIEKIKPTDTKMVSKKRKGNPHLRS